MATSRKTKAELVEQLQMLEARIAELEKLKTDQGEAEKVLTDSKERYRLLFENTNDVVYSIDQEFTLTSVSPSVERVLGYQPDELIGKKMHELGLMDPEYVELGRRNTLRVLSGERFGPSEYVFTAKDGTKKTGEISGAPLIKDGKIVGTINIARDITKRKRTEEALSRTHRALRTLSECSRAVVDAREESDLLHETCRTIVETGGYHMAWVGFAEYDKRKRVRPMAQWGMTEGYLDAVDITWADTQRGQGPTGAAIRTGEARTAQHILTDPGYEPWRTEALKRGYQSSIALPLVDRETIFGALNIYAAEPDSFDAEEVNLLLELAATLSHGISALRVEQRRKNAERELREYRDHLEELVTERTQELEKVNEQLKLELAARKLGEKKLRESEERYSSLFKNNRAVMLLINPESGKIIDSNPAARSFYGYTEEELKGKEISDINTLTAEQVFQELMRAKSEGREHLFFRHRRANGELRDVEVYSSPIAVHGKQLLYSIVHDITGRKRAEDALRKEKEKAQEYLDVAGVIMLAIGPDQRISMINRKGAEVLGFDEGEIVGKNWFDAFLPKRIRDGIREVFLQIIQEGVGLVEYAENPVVTASGEERIIAWHNSMVTDDKRRVIGTLSSGEDITERKRAEEALRESEMRFRQLAENVNTVFWVGAPDWKEFFYISPAYEKVWGRSCESLYENPFSWLNGVVEEDRPIVVGDMKRRQPSELKEPAITEFRVKRPDGSVRWIIARAFPVRDRRGKVHRIAGVATDFTERKLAEEILQTSNRFLQITNQHTEMQPLLREFAAAIQDLTKCEAVGIRILDDDGSIPYQTYVGFTTEFYESESPLNIRSDECMCINVIKGTVDPTLPFYTEGGSFYMNGTTKFLAHVSHEEKGNTRNVCNQHGYESVALIPIRMRDRILGLIHLTDTRENMVPINTVERMQTAAMQLGIAIARVRTEEALRDAFEESQRRAEETSALLESSRAVLEYQDFEPAAQAIFNSCKRIIGATAGYVALLSENGMENEVLLLESGGRPCNVDPSLPMPIRGLRAQAYSLQKPVYENAFSQSEWMGFMPEGHVDLDNVLFAPLILEGRATGVIGLANKPHGFNDDDARLAAAFADHAAIALQNSHNLRALQNSEGRYRRLSERLEEAVKKKVAELKQAESLAAVGQMVSTVAHEVRNPLQNIQMGVDSIRREIGHDKDKSDILEEIDYGINLLNGIITDLLDYARPVTLKYSKCPVQDIVRQALKTLAHKLDNIDTRLDLEEGDGEISVDIFKFTAVLVNLMSNAAEAMSDGGELRIGSTFLEQDGQKLLRISIADTGHGIGEKDLERIHEPFFTTKTKGTGLGIPVCRKIMDAHNGALSITSKPDGGTTAEITLPV